MHRKKIKVQKKYMKVQKVHQNIYICVPCNLFKKIFKCNECSKYVTALI